MEYKLFFCLIGCKLPNRYTEQHDVFFGIGQKVADLIPALKNFWPEATDLHIDCWREVTNVNGFTIKILPKNDAQEIESLLSLFFINLGGYKKDEFEEYHFKDLFVAKNLAEAIKLSKKTSFFKNYGLKGAVTHIDNNYGLDIDEIYRVEEILTVSDKRNFRIIVSNEIANELDKIHLGYTLIAKLGVHSDTKS